MLIVSWNVAGLGTTANRIHEAYKPSQAKNPSAAMANYFSRHGADIVCLQEHKIPMAQLIARSEPRQVANVEGFESFWSCCVDETKRGFNGVVTYSRIGTVISADSAPLGSPELDRQGRCIMTDHGSFALFNVYVPAASGQPLSYRMKFLNALRRAMARQRRLKPVILVGDLNIARTSRDIFWKDRTVFVNDILAEVTASTTKSADLPQWKHEVARNWNKITAALATKEAVSTQTTNTHNGQKFDKFRLAVTVDNRRIFLGKHETSPEYCMHSYGLCADTYFDEEREQRLPCQEENAVRLCVLAELMDKIVGVPWDEALLRIIAESDASIQRVSPSRKWLLSLFEEDNMVDAFRYFYPSAEARFTCWHQFTNRRYVNDGSRIDYTIVDHSLVQYICKGEVYSLRGSKCNDKVAENLLEEGALRAVTANGRFQPVSFEGGGIHEATRDALDTQFGLPHTGMIYTPPSFSDHIAISLMMDCCLRRDLVLNSTDLATRKAQPHKQQKTIATFFSETIKGSSTNMNITRASPLTKRATLSATSATGPKRTRAAPSSASGSKRRRTSGPPNKKKEANSILNHFQRCG